MRILNIFFLTLFMANCGHQEAAKESPLAKYSSLESQKAFGKMIPDNDPDFQKSMYYFAVSKDKQRFPTIASIRQQVNSDKIFNLKISGDRDNYKGEMYDSTGKMLKYWFNKDSIYAFDGTNLTIDIEIRHHKKDSVNTP
jgi:hypothetical protein